MTKRNIIPLSLLFVFALGACKGDVTPPPAPTPSPVSETLSPTPSLEPTPTPEPAEDEISAMTIEELAGQLLVVGVEGTQPGEDAHRVIEDLRPGGIILFGRNVDSAPQLAALTNGLKEINREAGNIPLFLCVDEEGGMVSRMPPEVADIPNAYDYLRSKRGGTEALGQILAAECATFGFHVDFAPVLDIWSNPNNTVIGKRSFHTDPLEVTIAGPSVAYSMMDAGVIPVVKHFPGHGDTATDSHVGLPAVDKTREELEDNELMPFRFAVDGGVWKALRHTPVPAVMVGHILLTEVDPLLPSSISPAVVDGLLRQELGFEGVVFTDDLTMGAISNTYSLGEAAVKAVQAGCDMLLVCHGLDNARAAHAALLEAVEAGDLTRSRLEESVGRILALKEAYGVDDSPVGIPDVEKLNEVIRAVIP